MSPTLEEQIEGLKRTIAETEAQRESLGDEFVDTALVPFQRKLDELVAMLEAQEARKARPAVEPAQQRKLVTLLFMDVVDSTQLTQHMDPEDVMEIIDGALRRLAEPVELYGGRVTRFMGDGFLSVFGAPTAREDDPEQAVRAGLAILELAGEIADEYRTEWEIQGFQVRVGISTGLVMLGGETEAEDTLMGAAVNLAARLENAAPSGGLLVSHDTYRHIRGVFDVEPWEPLQVKGFDEPVQVYRVLRAKARAFRTYTRGVEGVETRMIGRETELKYLQDALLTAIEENEGQMVTISGEAGVGKSRLLYEFRNWIELLPPPPVYLFEGRGRQEAQGQPYTLLRDLFEFRFQIIDEDRGETAREKIQAGFAEVFGEDSEGLMRAHILGQLLGFDFSASLHLKGVLNDAEQLRNRGLMYLGEYLHGLSGPAPVVIFLEDIHWADDSSLDTLNWLEERLHLQRLLVVCTSRPTLFERRPYWGEGQIHHSRMDLRTLSRRESRQLVGEILKLADQVPEEVRELVVEGAEGNPFYLEELVKMLVENGVILTGDQSWHIEAGRLASLEVPPTLAGVLQARLDSLPLEERVILQQASVVGRQFWDRVVVHIQASGNGREVLVSEALNALRQRELIYRREVSAFLGAREYLFKHDILREVTYESVLKRLRRVYHRLVADWLIAQGADRVGEYSGLIAEHLLLAGKNMEASKYFSQAGHSALASYANTEAEYYYRQALELSTPIQLRAELQSGLGEAIFRQSRSEEAKSIWQKTIELYRELGDSDHLGEVYARLSWLLWHTGDYLKAWNICQEGLELMEGKPDSPGYARLLAEAGRAAHFINVAEQVVPLCQRALEMAQQVGDLEVEAEASITLTFKKKESEESINILENVVALTEKEGLLRTAARAQIVLGWYLSEYLIDSDSALLQNIRAFENYRLIGDIDNFMFALRNVAEVYIELGELKTVKEKLIDLLKGSAAYETRVKEIFGHLEDRGWLAHAVGNWSQALEARQALRDRLQKSSSIQHIVKNNINLTNTILEINRFEQFEDLSEAERALVENIEISWEDIASPYWLAVVWVRQGRLDEALNWLNQTAEPESHFEEYLASALKLRYEFELALISENWSQALAASKSLLEIYQKSGQRWWGARTLIDLGDSLLGKDGPGDRDKAVEVFRQSLAMFTKMGAPGYVRLLEERLKSL